MLRIAFPCIHDKWGRHSCLPFSRTRKTRMSAPHALRLRCAWKWKSQRVAVIIIAGFVKRLLAWRSYRMDNKLVVDEVLQGKLQQAASALEICNQSGQTLGHFLPEPVYRELLLAATDLNIS